MQLASSGPVFTTDEQYVSVPQDLFPLTLRGVEDLLHQQGSYVGHEILRYRWSLVSLPTRDLLVDLLVLLGQKKNINPKNNSMLEMFDASPGHHSFPMLKPVRAFAPR
jgi:hypothetical protein